MDARQIEEKSKALLKADKAGESSSVLVGLLNDLKQGVKATEEILRSTRIGVTVNKFKQNKSPEVRTIASDCVRKWRDEVEKEKVNKGAVTKATNGSKKPTSQGGGATPQSGTASPAPAAKPKTESSIAPDKRTWKADKVDIHRTDSAGRDACVGLMYDGLVFLSTAPSASVLSIALAVEEAAYKNLQPETSSAYKDKMRMLFQNLKNKKNHALRLRVLSGEIMPEKLVTMTHEQLKSKEQREQEEEIREKNISQARAPVEMKSMSTELTCDVCKEQKVSFSQAQTRSADEPMTTFCECTVCGHRWKVSLAIVFRLLGENL